MNGRVLITYNTDIIALLGAAVAEMSPVAVLPAMVNCERPIPPNQINPTGARRQAVTELKGSWEQMMKPIHTSILHTQTCATVMIVAV